VKTANILGATLLATLAGCASASKPEHGPFAGDMLLGASLSRAIVAQSALYPCHFEPGGTQLNELGLRDLGVLTEHLRTHAGTLLVRRGDASTELHHGRVQAVLAALEQAGVAREQIAVHDGLPGGEGLASVRVVEILKKPLVLTGGGVSTTGQAGSSGTISP
jgi:hypothetical protein